ncbi:MAG: hypothetical protein IIA73_03760 [Proteobacteria bacterium]|nr:hypothetical protein [Pseudomonadota bacterium]
MYNLYLAPITPRVNPARAFSGVSRIPTLFVFDRDGRVVYDFVNPRGATGTNAPAELPAVIEPLL